MSDTIDLTFLSSFTSGDNSKMNRYIQMFLDKAPQQIEDMKTHLENKNWEDLKVVAHSLKPQLSYMGIKSLEGTIKTVETYAGDQVHLDELPDMLARVETTCKQAFQELKAHIERNS